MIFTFRFYSQSSRHIISPRPQTSFHQLIINILCAIIIIYQTFKALSKHLYLNNVFEYNDLYHCRKRLYLNNALENSDLYYYRNLSIIWNDLTRSCNSHIHLETFFSIETLFSHIFFGFQLPDFWCAFDDYQILFSKYRFLTKSGTFVWGS